MAARRTPLHSPAFGAPPAAWLLGHRHGRRRGAIAGLALASLALACAAGFFMQQGALLQAVVDSRSLQARPAAPVRPAATARPAVSADVAARANRVVRSLNTDWPAIFAALEREARPAEVALVALESDAERGAVRVVTEGPALDALLAHAERVQASPRFQRTRLLRVEPPEAGGQAVGPAGLAGTSGKSGTAGSAELSRLSFDLVLTP